MINSANDEIDINGLEVDAAKATITDWLASQGLATESTQYRLRDWLFSRQRYWGEPFPIVYNEAGTPVALPDSMLPVELPEVDAAKRYFGKSVKDITIGEAAILAGVVQNPNLLRIDKKEGTREIQGEMVDSAEDGYRYAKSRQNYVLNRMLEDGKITEDQHDKYHDAEIKPNITSRTQGCQQAGDTAVSSASTCTRAVLNDEAFGESADRSVARCSAEAV